VILPAISIMTQGRGDFGGIYIEDEDTAVFGQFEREDHLSGRVEVGNIIAYRQPRQVGGGFVQFAVG